MTAWLPEKPALLTRGQAFAVSLTFNELFWQIEWAHHEYLFMQASSNLCVQ